MASGAVDHPGGATPGQPDTIVLAPGMVCLDWLTLNMRAPDRLGFAHLPWEHIDPVRWDYDLGEDCLAWAAYMIEPTDKVAPPFGRIAYLNDLLGEKAATILFDPFNRKLHDPQWMQVQFANRTLYTGEWIRLFRMFRAIGCEYESLSRVDIACDGIEGEGGEWPAVLELAQKGKADYYGKADNIVRCSRGTVIGGEFGSRRSNKFVRAYRKKRELKRKGHFKPHIVDAWKTAFGFDAWAAPVEVNRFEVQLKGKEVRRYFSDEPDPDWIEGFGEVGQLVDVFASMATGLFDYRTPEHLVKRARDAKPVATWDWSRVNCQPAIQERAPRTLALSDHTLKVGIKAMWRVAAITGQREGFEAARQMAAARGPAMESWYKMRMGEWLKELRKIEAANDARTMEVLGRLRNGQGSGNA